MIIIQHTEINDHVVSVEVEGPLDSDTSPDFEDYINKLLEGDIRYILLDARNLKWISSEGIGVSILLHKKITQAGGAFVIFNLTDEVLSLYRVLGFDRIVRIALDRREALDIIERFREVNAGGIKNTGPEMEDEDNEPAAPSDYGKKKSKNRTGNDNIIDAPGTSSPVEILPEEDTTPSSPDGEIRFEPFVIECARCRSLVRIRRTGDFICPTCKAEFTVLDDQTVIF